MTALASFGLALVAVAALVCSTLVVIHKLRIGEDAKDEDADYVLLIVACIAFVAAFVVAPSSTDCKAPAQTTNQVRT